MKKISVQTEKEEKVMKRNFCGECGCSCFCDGGCKGYRDKCTSEEAIKKGCSHHCGCYIRPLTENYKR